MPKAIDLHIHPPVDGQPEVRRAQEAVSSYFRSEPLPKDSAEMADYYAELDIIGLLLTIDATTARNDPGAGNDYIASLVKKYPQQFPLGFGSVDPHATEAVDLINSVAGVGLRGVKYHPSIQEFFPGDSQFYPQYEACAKLGLPVMFHTGMTGIGAGQRGGGNVRTKYCRPIPDLDDIAAEFPELTLIMAHQAWPWVQEQLAVLVHKRNVYMEMSGYSPKYLDPAVITYANFRTTDRMMFGSDYPWIRPKRWLDDFATAPFNDDVRQRILYANAARLFSLEESFPYTG
ncbi:MAG TPA: amidohydrolase family protein [Dehalococcoidia bacterium]|nr:amidohydrolase family protein [Dehalococcoidia bacterium]